MGISLFRIRTIKSNSDIPPFNINLKNQQMGNLLYVVADNPNYWMGNRIYRLIVPVV